MTQEFRDPIASAEPFRLGNWLVEPSLNRLTRGDTTIQLELKVMDVLVCLAERAGEVVPRQEIVDRVWATEFISDNTLTHAVTELRNALGDDAKNPSFIETIHRRGYRLTAPVEAATPDQAAVSKVARFPIRERVVSTEVERSPYPGLAAFTEDDAEFFFGREAEVAQMWRKLTSRKLLAVIGPSGVGKSSFMRAGVIPAKPEGWAAIVCQPGEAPFPGLARALVPEFAGDVKAMAQLVDVRDGDRATAMVSRWRDRHGQALLIVDQFEELFTLNPSETQAQFAEVLRRLVDDADVHVVLAMRDDFLFHIHDYPTLAPVLNELTLLGAPSPESLRLAVVEPARRQGFAYEDDGLPGEMIAGVEGERGALPLLAFAVARLWDKRDTDRRLLTNRAYADIGGVGGALAGHAESTLKAIGEERLPIVREIFRNLVTAEGTRAVREADDLLTVFPESQHGDAEKVLSRLIDARLLTSFEEEDVEGDGRRRVEVVHETLLSSWPRLVRWQTQDADSARLRDQLRQAARTWDEHDRSDDLLWAGSVFREFAVWRENYPGGLTELEEDYASAMISHAKRRKRRRRIAVAAFLVIAAVVATVTTALWRRSVVQERRAEAQKLIALGQVRLEDYPTATLAFATRSLELADSEEARLLALEALWEGPTAFIVNETPSANASFSRGGDWLVQTHDFMSSLAIISRDGQQRFLDHPTDSGAKRVMLSFGASENFFVTEEFGNDSDWIGLWSASEGRLLASAKQVDDSDFFFSRLVGTDTGKPRALFVWGKGGLVTVEALHRDGSLERVGEFRVKEGTRICLDKRSGDWLVVEDNHVSVLRFRDSGLSDRRLLGRHEGAYRCMADPLGSLFFTLTRDGEMRRWNPSGRLAPMDFRFPASFTPFRYLPKQGFFLAGTVSENKEEISILSIGESGLELERSFDLTDSGGFWAFDPSGPWFVMRGPSPFHRLWSLAAPAGADPIVLRRGPSGYTHIPAFSPDGRWLATNDRTGLALWPLVRRYPAVIDVDYGQVPWGIGVAFALDGSFLAATGGSRVKVWSLTGPVPPAGRTAFEVGTTTSSDPAVSPDGEMFAVGSITEPPGVWIGRVGEEPLLLAGADELELGTAEVSFSPDGRFVAACDGIYDLAKGAFHVWEVSTGEKIAVLRLDGEQFRGSPGFVADGRLLTGLTKGVVAWDVETGEHEVVVDVSVRQAVSSVDGRRLLVTEEGKEGDRPQDPAGSPLFFDLDTGEVTDLTTHGSHVRYVAMDQDGTVAVTADADGVIRVGPVTGEEPHLLLGHDGSVMDLTVDPLGRWIASGGMDKTVRLWPMPDLSKPPLHTLPHDELIAKLHSLTNLRVVRDAESSTGWKLEVGPFPGWETVPTW